IGKANQNQFTPPTASNIYLFSHVQIAYTLDGIGRAALTFAGGDGKITFINTNPIDPYSDPPVQYPFDPKTDSFGFDNLSPNVSTLYGSVLVTAFEDRKIDVNVGFAYTLPAADKDNIITLYSPMQAGIGLSFGTSKMGFKTRAAAIFGGSAVRKGTAPLNKASMLGFGIMPYYGFGPCKVFLNAGISYKTADELMDGTDGNKVKPIKNTTAFGWTLNPYITLTFDSATVYAGLQIGSDGLKDSNGNAKVEWRIPLGIQYSF
ncbi:MAG: hypothetical protein FWC45_02265, partial [Treponema sp.]|nr:hypothetical protein [Treponema sp.]